MAGQAGGNRPQKTIYDSKRCRDRAMWLNIAGKIIVSLHVEPNREVSDPDRLIEATFGCRKAPMDQRRSHHSAPGFQNQEDQRHIALFELRRQTLLRLRQTKHTLLTIALLPQTTLLSLPLFGLTSFGEEVSPMGITLQDFLKSGLVSATLVYSSRLPDGNNSNKRYCLALHIYLSDIESITILVVSTPESAGVDTTKINEAWQ
ncbi:Aste57867_1619 [Aphanomyces stellatus]|uniref:Aste57867_1619 protein n=1 Tax=Aphanomyces stellatus TaxID=120398 RepID=A0A485KB26_9STRA|nr:hypothetical protein As57867_001617 [Aphanomyces stellatus]VFT78832.1 Aste57867_1619 [Aphanomyces stellatus]